MSDVVGQGSVPPGFSRIEGSMRAPMRGAKRKGPCDPDSSLTVTMYLRRRADAPPLPDLAYWENTPLDQRKYVDRAHFAATYGASPEDLAAATKFARDAGLSITEQDAGRRTVHVSGTVAQMNAAFAVDLGHYEGKGVQSYRGREGFIHLPTHVHGIIESVLGLDDRPVARHRATTTAHAAAAPANSAPAGASALTPPQVAGLYNFPTTSAAGRTVGILEFGGGYASSDVKAFVVTTLGLSMPTLTDVSVDSTTNSPAGSVTNNPLTNPDVEVILDIDVVAAVAQGAAIAVYFAPNSEQGFADAISTAAHDSTNAPAVISCSWGGSEDSWSSSGRNAVTTNLQEAAALGLTLFYSSGDDGSDDGVGDGSAHVDFPGSDPWVTCCGGTYIANVSGSTFTEGTWNDVGTTGGGVSDVFGLPGFQTAVGVPNSANDATATGRGVPDVSGNASPFSGYTLTLYGKLTTSLVITSGLPTGTPPGTVIGTIGGTSAVAPLYAALLATIEATINEPLGLLNPVFYGSLGGTAFVDINDGANNLWSGEAKTAPSYTCGAGWDACTGLGRVDGAKLQTALSRAFVKDVQFVINESTYSQDEVELQLPGQATFAAGWVQVDGFRLVDLGLTATTLDDPPPLFIPTITYALDPSLSAAETTAIESMLLNPVASGPVIPLDASLPNVPQSFLFPFVVQFNGDAGFTAMRNASPALTLTYITLTAQLTVAGANYRASAQITLTTGEDPRFVDVDPNNPAEYPSWLSFDLRLFKMAVPPGGSASRFGATVSSAADAPAFIASVISNLSTGGGQVAGDYFSSPVWFLPGLSQDEDQSSLEFKQTDDSGNFVYNFAVARVRLRAKSAATATNVRVFFRMFQAQNTVSSFDTATTYRSASDGVVFGHRIALLGTQNDQSGNPEYVTIPCFATPRIVLTDRTKSMSDQDDPPNARDLATSPGGEIDYFFGCWIDNNQPSQGIMPTSPPAGNVDGPWPEGEYALQSMQAAFTAFPHQCLIAEISYDDAPIPSGATSSTSDKLAQRNIAWLDAPNPGVTASRRVSHPVQVRATGAQSLNPDELMILWGETPRQSNARLYLPAISARDVFALAQARYPLNQLTIVDAHTLGFLAEDVTFIPLPRGTGLAAGLLSLDLPATVVKGDAYSIVVLQLTDARASHVPPAPPPPTAPRVTRRADPLATSGPRGYAWRRVEGAFQFTINVSTKGQLLLPEQRLLAVLRWMLTQTDTRKRWYPIMLRYIADVAGRITGFGGDPTRIGPSPTGDIPGIFPRKKGGSAGTPSGDHGDHGEQAEETCGKISAIIYDHFGSFEGFIVEEESAHQRRFLTREQLMLVLVERAWIERIHVCVVSEKAEPDVPRRVIFRI